MQQEILNAANNHSQLEALYGTNKQAFKRAFNSLDAAIFDPSLHAFWDARLNSHKTATNWGSSKDWLFVITTAVIAAIIAKIPAFFLLDEELFYSRNIGFIILPALTAFFVWKQSLPQTKWLFIIGFGLAAIFYINLLPQSTKSDTITLACIHLPFFLWSILGYAFGGGINVQKRLLFLRYNGDLLVITALLVIAGGILSGITMGLFSLLGFKIEEFYVNWIVVMGLPAAPIIGSFLIYTNPQLVGKISPVIAKIFSPLVLFMLVIYLGAMLVSGKSVYTDREFLLLFNILLIGVMAIIFFSVAEGTKGVQTYFERIVLLLLALVTIIVNSIALSAILFRISSWGITPNRIAVLGGNILILTHLILVTTQIVQVVRKKKYIESIAHIIVIYLPIYTIWAMVVCFLLPLIFGYK